MKLDRALGERRTLLRKSLPGRQVLLAAGGFVSRNYPANTYPFRASSHFLYFFGKPLPNAFGLITEDQAILFCRPRSSEDAVWSGVSESWEDLKVELGVDEIRPLEDLPGFVPVSSALSLPVQDRSTNQALISLLGREPGMQGEDAELARAVVSLRLIQDDLAITELRSAAQAGVAAHLRAMRLAAAGMSERRVLAELEYECAARGMTTSFQGIVTGRCEALHIEASARKLSDGELLLVDFGAETPGGYASDITRTFPVGASFSSAQRDIYELVLAAHEAALSAAQPGVRWLDVHLAASRVIAAGLIDLGLLAGEPSLIVERGAHTLFFPHGVGHLIGLDVHDMEDLGDLSGYPAGRARSAQFGLKYLRFDRDLEPGMAVTIEPGIYFNSFLLDDPELSALWRGAVNRERFEALRHIRGVRIEDTVLITESRGASGGNEVLTADAPKAAAAVEEIRKAAQTKNA